MIITPSYFISPLLFTVLTNVVQKPKHPAVHGVFDHKNVSLGRNLLDFAECYTAKTANDQVLTQAANGFFGVSTDGLVGVLDERLVK